MFRYPVHKTAGAFPGLHVIPALIDHENLALFANVIGQNLCADPSGTIGIGAYMADSLAVRCVGTKGNHRFAGSCQCIDQIIQSGGGVGLDDHAIQILPGEERFQNCPLGFGAPFVGDAPLQLQAEIGKLLQSSIEADFDLREIGLCGAGVYNCDVENAVFCQSCRSTVSGIAKVFCGLENGLLRLGPNGLIAAHHFLYCP